MVKKDGMILEQSSLWLKRDGVIRKNTAPEGGYIPNPYGRDLGLGYRIRTLPQGRDRWGR